MMKNSFPLLPTFFFYNSCDCDRPGATCMEIDSWLTTSYDATSSSSSIYNMHSTLDNENENCISFDLFFGRA